MPSYLLFHGREEADNSCAEYRAGDKVGHWLPGTEETEATEENQNEVDDVGLEYGLLGGAFVADVVLSSEDSVVFDLSGHLFLFGFGHGGINFSGDTVVNCGGHLGLEAKFGLRVGELQNIGGNTAEYCHNVPSTVDLHLLYSDE